jgi:prepilin-type N-terminal cleavage/methylation domain-containing protein
MLKKISRAFTLIEMLVVIAIIAVLAALLFPAIGGMQERGKATQDLSNLRQIGLGTQMYLNDNDGVYFLPNGPAAGSPTVDWMQALTPKYLPSWKIFKSAFDVRTATEDSTSAPVSFGFNVNAAISATSPLSADRVTNPSVFILFAPAQDNFTQTRFAGTAGTAVTVDRGGASSPGGTALGGTQASRKRTNACMADLHVETMSWGTTGVSGYVNDQHTSTDQSGNQRWDPTATPAPAP